MENISCFCIPPLQCSSPLKCHPDFPFVVEKWNEWMLSTIAKPAASEDAKRLLIQSQFPFFVCHTYPNSDSKRLFLIFKMMAWLFLCEDDSADDPEDMGVDPAAADALYARLSAVLEGRPHTPNDLEEKVGEGLQKFSNIWNELRADMPSQAQQARFIQSFKDYMDAMKMLIGFRKAQRVPDVETYIELRLHTAWCLPAFILLEYSLGMELDHEAVHSPTMRQLLRAAANHIAWSNDLLSFRKESSMGDNQNLLVALCYDNSNLGFQEIVHRVCNMIREVDQECVALIDAIKNSNLIDKPGLCSYIDSLGFWMAANIHWSYRTARYHGVEVLISPENRPVDVILHARASDDGSPARKHSC